MFVKISKVSVHCLDCDSNNIVMLNANGDFQIQQWIYNENSLSSFLCRDCSVGSKEILWRAETDILGHALVEKENNNA